MHISKATYRSLRAALPISQHHITLESVSAALSGSVNAPKGSFAVSGHCIVLEVPGPYKFHTMHAASNYLIMICSV